MLYLQPTFQDTDKSLVPHEVREAGFFAPFPDLRLKEFAAVCCGIAWAVAEEEEEEEQQQSLF